MMPLQTLKDNNNREIVLFPFEYLYMSQDEGGDHSHENTYNIDFLGYNGTSIISSCPFYAPVTLKCVDIWDSSNNNRVYESVDQVHFADGTIDYLTIAFAHDNSPVHNVGDVINQGELLGHTGSYGQVTGDHTHTCCGKGRYEGYTERTGGHYDLTNRCHYWDATFVNNTTIVRGYNHNWVIYETPVPPYTIVPKPKFPWVLYARKLRNKKS